MGQVTINSMVEYRLWGGELISPDIAGMFRWILGVREMTMYQVTYEIKRGNQQDIKTVLVGASNRFEAKSAVEISETVAGEWDTFWHVNCKGFYDGEVVLISSKGTV